MKSATSKTLFARAQKYIPGGVNSPVRAFRSVGGHPLFITRAQGATVTDADGNTYLDYVASWGPMILGHAHPGVVRAIQRAAGAGTSYGAPTLAGTGVGPDDLRGVPVRRKGSTREFRHGSRDERHPGGPGLHETDAILKFEGCYHGHADSPAGEGGVRGRDAGSSR